MVGGERDLGLRAAFNPLPSCEAENCGVRSLIEFHCLPAYLPRHFEVAVFFHFIDFTDWEADHLKPSRIFRIEIKGAGGRGSWGKKLDVLKSEWYSSQWYSSILHLIDTKCPPNQELGIQK